MWIMRRNCNLVNKARAQPLDGPHRSAVVWVAGDRNSVINRPDKWCNGATCLKCVATASERLQNLESDVPCTNSNMLCIANAKIDVPNLRTIDGQYAEMVKRNEAA
jgi:hypothetical protein